MATTDQGAFDRSRQAAQQGGAGYVVDENGVVVGAANANEEFAEGLGTEGVASNAEIEQGIEDEGGESPAQEPPKRGRPSKK